MPENEPPVPISQPVEEALLRILRPDLLAQYNGEKERHREELRQIEQACQRARAWIWQTFRGPLREQKREELEQEYVERVQGEEDRHANWLAELRATIRDHWTEPS